jgi:hypothetical protein
MYVLTCFPTVLDRATLSTLLYSTVLSLETWVVTGVFSRRLVVVGGYGR